MTTQSSTVQSLPYRPSSLPRPIVNVPVAGQDAEILATHELMQKLEKEKIKQREGSNSPTLEGRVAPPNPPETEANWSDEVPDINVTDESLVLEDHLSFSNAPEKEMVWLEGLQNNDITDFTGEFSGTESSNTTPRNQLTSSSSSSYTFSMTPSPKKTSSSFSPTNSGVPGYLSASFITPNNSPINTEMTTPEALKNLDNIIDKSTPGYDLTPKTISTLQRAMEKINSKISPERSKLKGQASRRFSEALEKTGTTSAIVSPNTRRRLFSSENVENVSRQWTIDLAKFFDTYFVDANHITDLEGTGGFHICPEGHPHDALVLLRRINLATGVWCGRIHDLINPQNIKKAFSSFIPRTMSFDEFKVLLSETLNNDTLKIAQQDNRRLYRIVDGKTSFVIECYFHHEGTLIRSAMPLFHYEVFQGTEKSFKLHYFTQKSLEDVLVEQSYEIFYETLLGLIKTTPVAIIYDMDEKIIVDLGILFQVKNIECPVEKGLYVEIPKKFLL